ncbi:type III polyketide synthase [Sutcliffiella rhizosphaerae]|uniref:Alpha-pyrone synthesis polyketide synthase-like Pks11 n=1 Tax=Sutcliffiella rhizosphaerae TaxID=2880967 RepID=A0ABM8YUQ0_9BACI|nr:3-oxoacyl-[acyl-carrier-protein] synthase III C-terminal domain-containing protein [Sutcliffiella rhizosphaerae]CAG9623695.1 Alpha-pyrone synthesis polyketide synthase-like Pks11 [Sutcliffiella rhizosphaerae]
MPKIISIGTSIPKYEIDQVTAAKFAEELFEESFKDISRLLTVFQNGLIEKRHFVRDIEWFKQRHSIKEKNDIYIHEAVAYGTEAINSCLLKESVPFEDIEAIFFISTTGFSTPSIEARIMNILPFSPFTKRIPIWGLGCAGGAAGLSRAYEYCLAFPKAKVLILCVELCSLTFQKNDRSKSNLIGTSLFADGIACVLMVGDEVKTNSEATYPKLLGSQSTLMKESEDVMGWEIRDGGLYVVFSRDIPNIITDWLGPNVERFLARYHRKKNDLSQFVLHPGGLKILDAYQKSLGIDAQKLSASQKVLKEYGNMSSATVIYVLKEIMESNPSKGDLGLAAAMGPGFSSEMLLMEWE